MITSLFSWLAVLDCDYVVVSPLYGKPDEAEHRKLPGGLRQSHSDTNRRECLSEYSSSRVVQQTSRDYGSAVKHNMLFGNNC